MFIRTLLIFMLTVLTLGAQGRPFPERSHREGPDRPGAFRRERIAQQVHELRQRKLQDSLGLPPEKAKSIADRWSQFDQDSSGRRKQMAQLRQQVDSTLRGPGSEEEKNRKLQPMVEQLAGLRLQQQQARTRFEEGISASLSPAQQGRFILLVEDFQKSLQEAIQGIRKDR